jgi:hypothetical protein
MVIWKVRRLCDNYILEDNNVGVKGYNGVLCVFLRKWLIAYRGSSIEFTFCLIEPFYNLYVGDVFRSLIQKVKVLI